MLDATAQMRFTRRRFAVVVATCCYALAFHITYRDLVVPRYEGWGAGYRTLPSSLLMLVYAASILPSFWMPIVFRRPSQLFYYIQYYLVYIPCAFVVFWVSRPELALSEAKTLLAWMAFGITILQAGYLFPLIRIARPRIAPQLVWTSLGLVACALAAYFAIVLRGNFQLVGLANVYDVRAAMGDVIVASGSALVTYAQLWTANLILPLTFALGVYSRRWWMAGLSLAGYVFIFGVSGQKVALMAVLYLPLFYWILKPKRKNIPAAVATGLTVVLLSGYLVVRLASPLVATWFIAVLHFRTFTIQAINFSQYFAFFQTHPVTHLSHLSGIRWFVHYPYELDVPFTLGYYFYGVAVGNNGGMWAADAIAGIGPWGIPIISAVAAMVFWVLDSCARDLNPRFIALAVAYMGLTFANVSLGTTLITGGLAFLWILLLFLPRHGFLAESYLPPEVPLSRLS